jgi:hypothetical protein
MPARPRFGRADRRLGAALRQAHHAAASRPPRRGRRPRSNRGGATMRRILRALPLALPLLASACAAPAATVVDRGPALPVVEYVTRQEILTPLPLRVSLPARYGAERVIVFVHLWGLRDWSVLELGRAGQTWAGEVSCRAVSTITGDTRYFFLAIDAQGRTVVGSGSPEWPHVATIVGKLADGPQALPGEAVPLRCHDPADCPPDLPGCPAYAVLRPRCDVAGACPAGGRCAWDGYCDGAPEAPPDGATDEELLARAVRKATGRYQTAAAPGPARR